MFSIIDFPITLIEVFGLLEPIYLCCSIQERLKPCRRLMWYVPVDFRAFPRHLCTRQVLDFKILRSEKHLRLYVIDYAKAIMSFTLIQKNGISFVKRSYLILDS